MRDSDSWVDQIHEAAPAISLQIVIESCNVVVETSNA